MTKELTVAAVGACLLLVALAVFLRRRARLSRWVSTTGVLVGYRVRATRRDGRRRTYHHPLVQYERQGVACMHDSAVGTSQPRWEVGAALPVLYDPASHDDACIDTVGEKYFIALWLAAAGTITTVVGVAVAR